MDSNPSRESILESLTDAFVAYRHNPQTGGYDALRKRVKESSRKVGLSPAMLLSEMSRRAEARESWHGIVKPECLSNGPRRV